MISMTIQGAKELERKLATLEPKIAKKVVRKAVRIAAKITQQATKANARAMVGGNMGSVIAKNTVVRAFKRQRRGQFGVSVRLRPDVGEFIATSKAGKKNYIPSAIEYGHAAPGDGGSGTKIVAATPFMRGAFESTKERAKRAIINGISKGISQAMK